MGLASGTTLGPYEILTPVGVGGMGEVYRARDSRLDRIVAVKVLPAELADRPESRQRLEQEARAISKLSHPNICTLHDIGEQDGIDYLVMEYIEGETLERRLTKGPLPPEQALQYGIQVANALGEAHRQGITHHDLKPGNIMLTKSGSKLLDFGLARLRTQEAPLSEMLAEMTTETLRLTAKGMIVGTFQYMAPEQLEGHEPDARSDIFALGVVLYEMVTGKAAFNGKTRASMIAAILSSDPPPVSSTQPMFPPALDRVVKKCLAKNPDKRWQSAADLASELEWILEWIKEAGSQAATLAPAVARRRTGERLVWAAALLLILASAVLFHFHRPLTTVAPVAFEIAPPGKSQVERIALSPDGVADGGRLATCPDQDQLELTARGNVRPFGCLISENPFLFDFANTSMPGSCRQTSSQRMMARSRHST